MILNGACYYALIQLCRVILSRVVEPYCSQSFLTFYGLFLTSTVLSVDYFRLEASIDAPVFPLSMLRC